MTPTEAPSGTREKIIEAAAALLQQSGPAAVTTRGVAQQAGVQAPTIYRLFGDKDGLLEAVAEHVMTSFVTAKAAIVAAASAENVDPLDDLRAGWQTQIDFGLANPALFRLLSDPSRVLGSPAARSGKRVLEARVHRLALAGRLRVSEQRAVGLIQAAGTGAIQTLLTEPVEQRDPGLADDIFDAVLRQMLAPEPAPAPAPGSVHGSGVAGVAGPQTKVAAVSLRAAAPELAMLTAAERGLLTDWLDRAIAAL